LGQQALLYRRMQVVAPIKIEWVPMSRQVNGMVVLAFRTAPEAAWTGVTDAVRDPEARRGPLDRPLTLTVSPQQLLDSGRPHGIYDVQGALTWLVTSDNHPTEPKVSEGEVPLGTLRISTAVLLSEKESASTVAEMFKGVAVNIPSPSHSPIAVPVPRTLSALPGASN